jgi:3'(2'), 5'-bisphosphate nucleotidase
MDSLFSTPILDHLGRVEKIARDAGHAIMEVYKKAIEVSYKSDSSPLTEADLRANRIIVDALKKDYPGIPILTEEAVHDFKGPSDEGFYWLVDPLDGTKEFIKRNGEFTVNIALILKGEPILGVVFAPEKKLLYRGAKDHGAYKREGDGGLKKIQTLKHEVGSTWIVAGSRSHSDEAFNAWLKSLGEHTVIPLGSSLKMCLIAEGLAHIYPRLAPTSLWDTAAAHAILKEAGGEIKDLNGEILNYADPSQVLNPFFIARSEV